MLPPRPVLCALDAYAHDLVPMYTDHTTAADSSIFLARCGGIGWGPAPARLLEGASIFVFALWSRSPGVPCRLSCALHASPPFLRLLSWHSPRSIHPLGWHLLGVAAPPRGFAALLAEPGLAIPLLSRRVLISAAVGPSAGILRVHLEYVGVTVAISKSRSFTPVLLGI